MKYYTHSTIHQEKFVAKNFSLLAVLTKIKTTNYFNYTNNSHIQILTNSHFIKNISSIMLVTKMCWIKILIDENFLTVYNLTVAKVMYHVVVAERRL